MKENEMESKYGKEVKVGRAIKRFIAGQISTNEKREKSRKGGKRTQQYIAKKNYVVKH